MSEETVAINSDIENAPDLMNRSVLRAMTLLSELGHFPQGATAADLAAKTGLARPTVFRLLLSMEHSGMLVKVDGKFTLGWEVARLGRIADPYRDLQPQIQAFIESLATELGESCSFSIVRGPHTIDLIAEASGGYMLSTAMGYVGKDMPLHASAMGKVLLASLTDEQIIDFLPEQLESFTSLTITDRAWLLQELAEVRIKDYGSIDNELEEGLFALAVPVRNSKNEMIGILSISGLDQRMKAANIHTYIEAMRKAAQRLTSTVLNV